MNRLLNGLGTFACLGFFAAAHAANGSVAASMAKDFWLAVKRAEAQAREAATVAQAQQVQVKEGAVPATRPPTYIPRPAR
jgi:hypothetical protein